MGRKRLPAPLCCWELPPPTSSFTGSLLSLLVSLARVLLVMGGSGTHCAAGGMPHLPKPSGEWGESSLWANTRG